MKFGVLGTGDVGQTIAGKLSELGHSVAIGTRDIAKTSGRSSFTEWYATHPNVELMTLVQAAKFGEIIVNATAGSGSLEALEIAGAENLGEKILIDIANPLEFSEGMLPTLKFVNDTSLGEQIQAAFPGLKLVKALNTLASSVMVQPDLVPGDHNVFLAGNDQSAKSTVTDLLAEFGWRRENVIDLGDVTASLMVEMLLPFWIRLWGVLGTTAFNINIVR